MPAFVTKRTIIAVCPGAVHDENVCTGSTIQPGMRLRMNSSDQLAIESTQGALGSVIIATENEGLGKTVNDIYASGDVVFTVYPRSGDIVNVLLTGLQNVVIGDALIVTTTGKYIKTTGTPAQTDFIALEASNVASDVLIRARKI